MPCKGVSHNYLENWTSQLTTTYPGHVEWVYVVEQDGDEAHQAIGKFLTHYQEKNQLSDEYMQRISVVVSGVSRHNAQKIHNMIHGVGQCPNAKYVCFFDDDIRVHPGCIETMVTDIEEDPSVLVSTGYSVEFPRKDAPFACFCITVYRSINLLGFLTRRPQFAWGGCFMTHRQSVVSNYGDILNIWRDGGYSDDMAVGNMALRSGRKIASHPSTMFPNRLPNTHTFGRSYVNFVKRQFFVLDTYYSPYDHAHNVLTACCVLIAGLLIAPPVLFTLINVPLLAARFIVGGGIGTQLNLQYSLFAMFLIGAVFLALSHNHMIETLVDMINRQGPPNSLKMEPFLSPVKIVAALVVHLFVMPYAMASVLLQDYIDWGAVRYHKKNGRIVRAEHMNLTDEERQRETETEKEREGETERDGTTEFAEGEVEDTDTSSVPGEPTASSILPQIRKAKPGEGNVQIPLSIDPVDRPWFRSAVSGIITNAGQGMPIVNAISTLDIQPSPMSGTVV
ncbi:ceramide glucosyltransferase, partial [Kipferlia bialata]|eukprot:g5236.t1